MIDSVIFLCELKIIHLVPLREIALIKAQRSYCLVSLCNGKTITHSKPLASVIKHLDDQLFLRIGQSHVVNRNQIRQIDKVNKLIRMSNGFEIHYPMKTSELLNLLGGFAISEDETGCWENE